jgi:hypothetical protein
VTTVLVARWSIYVRTVAIGEQLASNFVPRRMTRGRTAFSALWLLCHDMAALCRADERAPSSAPLQRLMAACQ